MIHHRLHFFTGKGGTGKTTIASLFALTMANLGKKVLLIDLDPESPLSSLFHAEKATMVPKPLAPNIDGIFIDPMSSLREFIIRQIKIAKIYDLIFENKIFHFFMKAAPGVEEMALIGKIYYLTEGRWDTLIVDTPATGHGLYLFKIPKVFMELTQKGPLAEQSEKIYSALTEKRQTAIHLVSLAEELPVQETIELFTEIKKLKLPMGELFLNKKLEISPFARDDENDEKPPPSPSLLHKIEQTLLHYQTRKRLQQSHQERLEKAISKKAIPIPWIFEPLDNIKSLKPLSQKWAKEWVSA